MALSVLAIAAARRALRFLSQWIGIKESDALQTVADNAITAGIHYAEEFVSKRIRQVGQVHDVEGDDKRSIAKNVARSLAPAALASVTEDQLDMLVDAKVQSMRPFMSSLPPIESQDSTIDTIAGTTYRVSLPATARLPTLKTPIPPKARR